MEGAAIGASEIGEGSIRPGDSPRLHDRHGMGFPFPGSSGAAFSVYWVQGVETSHRRARPGQDPRGDESKRSLKDGRSHQHRSRRRWRGPSRVPEMHGLGRHGPGLDGRRRRASRRGHSARTRPGRQRASFSFVQISDSHIGFDKDPNKRRDRHASGGRRRINALPRRPTSCSTPATSPTSRRPRNSTPSPRSSRGPRSARSSTCRASTTSSATARNT